MRELSPRELEVLQLIGAGLTNRQIAERLYISPKTASIHVSHILTKLDVPRRVHAAHIAYRLGLTSAAADSQRECHAYRVRRPSGDVS